jgi:hypothetical protein
LFRIILLQILRTHGGNQMKLTQHLLAVVFVAALAACGGGGGGGPTPNNGIPPASAATPLSSTNFGSIAAPAAASILAASGVSSGLDTLTGSTKTSNTSISKLGSVPSNWAVWSLNLAKPRSSGAQAVQSGSEPCPAGGSLSFTLNDADNNNDVSRGDVYSFTANNCVAATGELPINGSFSIAINAISFDANDNLTAASLTMSFNNFTSAGNTLNGAVTVAVNSNGATTTYTNFSSARGASSPSLLNYTAFVNNSGQLSINGLITVNNNTYTLSTVTLIGFGANYPTSGLLRVTDAAGNRVDIISNPTAGGSFDCDLYLTGDQVRDGRISGTWATL